MSASSASVSPAALQMRGARASTVIVHHVPPEQEASFLESEREITKAAQGFPGYQATEIYPPSVVGTREWVVVMHFDDQASLQKWIDSPIRLACIEKLKKDIGKFELKTLPSGFGAWFAGLVTEPKDLPPPGWKMVVTVLFALYPIVMLLAIFVGPYTSPLGMAVAMLIANALSCSLLQWVGMPIVTKLLGPWLKANDAQHLAYSMSGLALILVCLASCALIFRLVTG
jgi:antibiotic biosynthesis monooxygenase (ABM) superfamily enzyme